MTECSLRPTQSDERVALLVDLGGKVGRDGELIARDRPRGLGQRGVSGGEQAAGRVERARRSCGHVVMSENRGLRVARRERVGEALVQALATGRPDRREHGVAHERVREGEAFGIQLA